MRLLKAAGLQKGAANPGHEIVGSVTNKQIYHIAQLKMKDLATIEEFQKRLRQSEATAFDNRTQGGKNDVALRAANNAEIRARCLH